MILHFAEHGGGKPGDPLPVSAALRGSVGPLMRQIRKYTAFSAFLAQLPPELQGMAAPFDVRLAPPEGTPAGEAEVGGLADRNTLFVYVTSMTVAMVLEQQKRALIERVNAALPHQFIEDLRCEQVTKQKIERQLNILALEPD